MFKNGIGIAKKVREHGIAELLKRLVSNRLNGKFYYNAVKLIFFSNPQGKRILGIWDYKSLPWSVGDPLVFVEKLSMLRIERDAEEVDICIVYDRANPSGNRRAPYISPADGQDYALNFLPLFGTCPYLGSIFQFNSREEFYRFLKTSSDRYSIFPPFGKHLSESYNFADSGYPHFKEMYDFYDTYGYIPYLRIGEKYKQWAQWFYKTNLPENTVPVTLSLRQPLSSNNDTEYYRNADPAAWLSFIDQCKESFPGVVLVVVGTREEVFDGLREQSNVIIAKDFGTNIMEDCALIRASFLYMGTCSGVNAIALFSDLPHLLFQFPGMDNYGLKMGDNFPFQTDKQKVFSLEVPVTSELLFNQFESLYVKLNREEWQTPKPFERR